MRVLLLIVFSCVILSGCIVYGRGDEVCYVSAVDDGFFWAKVFTKTDLSSSDADTYLVEKENNSLRVALMVAAEKKQRIKIHYDKHLMVAAVTKGGSDEIKSFDIIK